MFPCINGTTKGSHQFRHIAPDHLSSGQLFQGTHHGIVAHGSTLYYNMLSQFRNIFQFQHLIQTILYNRISKSRSDIIYRSTFTKHLLYLRIHEDSTTWTQIARFRRTAGSLWKIVCRISQRIGKSFDKRSTAWRTSLVDFNTVNNAVVHKYGFHILSADIQNKRNVFIQIMGCHIVGYRFHNAGIQLEGCFD